MRSRGTCLGRALLSGAMVGVLGCSLLVDSSRYSAGPESVDAPPPSDVAVADGFAVGDALCVPDEDGDGLDGACAGGSDCDDADARVHPAAWPTCSDGRAAGCGADASLAAALGVAELGWMASTTLSGLSCAPTGTGCEVGVEPAIAIGGAEVAVASVLVPSAGAPPLARLTRVAEIGRGMPSTTDSQVALLAELGFRSAAVHRVEGGLRLFASTAVIGSERQFLVMCTARGGESTMECSDARAGEGAVPLHAVAATGGDLWLGASTARRVAFVGATLGSVELDGSIGSYRDGGPGWSAPPLHVTSSGGSRVAVQVSARELVIWSATGTATDRDTLTLPSSASGVVGFAHVGDERYAIAWMDGPRSGRIAMFDCGSGRCPTTLDGAGAFRLEASAEAVSARLPTLVSLGPERLGALLVEAWGVGAPADRVALHVLRIEGSGLVEIGPEAGAWTLFDGRSGAEPRRVFGLRAAASSFGSPDRLLVVAGSAGSAAGARPTEVWLTAMGSCDAL